MTTEWKLVPAEPTQEMLTAVSSNWTTNRKDSFEVQMARNYRRMLATAPQPVQEPVAWMFEYPDKRVATNFDTCPHGGKWVPHYTHPAPDQGAEVHPLSELGMHRAAHQMCKDAGFESPEEVLAAYKLQCTHTEDLRTTHGEEIPRLRKMLDSERGSLAMLESAIKERDTANAEIERLQRENLRLEVAMVNRSVSAKEASALYALGAERDRVKELEKERDTLREQLAKAQNSDEHNFQRWLAAQEHVRVLSEALEKVQRGVHGPIGSRLSDQEMSAIAYGALAAVKGEQV